MRALDFLSRRHFRWRPSITLVFTTLVGLSCNPEVDIPEGPDLSDVAAVYDSPTGTVDETTLEDVLIAAQRELQTLRNLGELDFVVETLEDVGETVNKAAKADASDDSLRPITGVAEVASVCTGHDPDFPLDPENGDLNFTLTIEDSYVSEVIWGEFAECKFIEEDIPIEIDSTMNIYLGEPVSLATLDFEQLLFRLDGTVDIGSESIDIAFDFRILPNTRLEIRVPATDGDVILRFGLEENEVSLRTADGSLCCLLDQRECFKVSGSDCDEAQAGDEKLSW